jgi:thiamine-phosphate pyrophosphorylase
MMKRGLYVITSADHVGSPTLTAAVAQAIQGGATLVQYRNKHADYDQKLWEASDLQSLCQSLSVPLIINDDVEIAANVHAAGVHLGKDDADIKQARQQLGNQAIIGVSCYNNIERAQQAEQDGADYVAFGCFFSSNTKPEAPPANPEILTRAKQHLSIPIVAIGGITAENAKGLLDHGADMLAVINGVFSQADITAAARELSNLF